MPKRKNYLLMAVLAVTIIGIVMVSIEQCVLDRGVSLEDPFKFTIDTNINMPDNQRDVVITVLVTPIDEDDDLGLYDLDCNGDGEFELMGITQPHNCIFKRNTGKYQIWVRGPIPRIILCPDKADNQNAVVSVDDWGDIQWQSMAEFANDCKNLEKIPQKAPNLNNQYIVRDMSRMFAGAHKFNQPLNHWDVSSIENMEYMFYEATSFNQPLDKWNVHNVENMSGMFSKATSFNQPLNHWRVSNVKNMSWMFAGAHQFNQPLDRWDVFLTRDMKGMFQDATSFNQPLNHWNVFSVTDMSWMFAGAHQFNQPLNSWSVRQVNDMNHMFYEATSFNQPLDNWWVLNVSNMESMFEKATSFSYYPKDWLISDGKASNMFTGTKVEEIAERQPLNRQVFLNY